MQFKDFELTLSNVSKFDIAKFERKIYKSHFSRLKRAINNKQMIDNIITVIPSGNQYKIIDGQHRFLALIDLLNEGLNKKFNLHLRILDEKSILKDAKEEVMSLKKRLKVQNRILKDTVI